MIDGVDEEGETENVGQENEFLGPIVLAVEHSLHGPLWNFGIGSAYMANLAGDLPDPHQEVQRCHPFRGAEASLARKVVQMRDEALEEVCEALVASLRVDAHRVLRDIVNVEILHRRSLDLRGIHVGDD